MTAPDPVVTERLGRFLRSRDPHALWPGLSDRALATARLEIERVVRAVLADQPAVLRREAATLYPLRIAAFVTGTGAQLGRWIEDGRVEADAAVTDLLRGQLAEGRRRAERILRGVLPACDALLEIGVTPVILKGFHTSHAFSEEPGVRPVADVDMLVPASRVDDVERALKTAGFVPRTARQSPYKRHWITDVIDRRHYSVEGIDARSPWEIDLHVTFDRTFSTLNASLSAFAARVEPYGILGRRLLVPAQPLLLLVLAFQISQDLKSLRLMRLVDLVRVVRADVAAGRLSWSEVLAAGATLRFAYPALSLANDLAPGLIDPRVLATAHDSASTALRRVTAGLRPSGAGTDQTSLATLFMWAHGPRERFAIARGLARTTLRDGPREILATVRAMTRRLVRGALRSTPIDERHDGARRPPRPEAPSSADRVLRR